MNEAVTVIVTGAKRRHLRFLLTLAVVTIICIIIATIGMSFGAVAVPADHVWQVVFAHLRGQKSDLPMASDNIIWLIRAPRVVTAGLIGATLSLIGVAIQAMVRNPLADPYVLGIQSGAAAGAVAVITILGSFTTSLLSPAIGALIGALGTVVLVFSMSQSRGTVVPLRLLLVGVACSYALSGLTTFMQYSTHDPAGQAAILFWLIGGLGGADWPKVPLLAGTLLVSLAVIWYYARALNVLAIGDPTAIALGLRPHRIRMVLFVVLSLAVAVAVSMVGPIGFVGLVVPHVGRLLVGADHRRLVPLSVGLGAAYLMTVDVIARMIFAPSEIPVGVLTAVFGAPIFVWMIRRRDALRTGGAV